jgi:hypothetical protein
LRNRTGRHVALPAAQNRGRLHKTTDGDQRVESREGYGFPTWLVGRGLMAARLPRAIINGSPELSGPTVRGAKTMSRKLFDILTSTAGVVVVILLLIAGGLLTWGHSFVNDNVHSQLAQQQIYFPPKAAFDHPKAGTEITPSMIPSVSQYAGQQLLTGAQAKTYANDFIRVHLSEMPYGGVYSKISAAAMANPKNTQLAELKQTAFTGTTLRGLLLEAYAFSTIGTIMLWGAIAAFVGAIAMSLLVGLGFWHAHRTEATEQMPASQRAVPVSS